MLPITNEQAEAIKAVSDLGRTVVEQTGALARCLGRILGTIPEDAVGIVLGDPLHFVRQANALKIDEKLEVIRARRDAASQPVSLSVALPLVRAAYDESRPELQDLWAALIAAAMDPVRSSRVRLQFIETVKQFDPVDAVLLQSLRAVTGNVEPNASSFWAAKLSKRQDEIAVSIVNLERLGCVFLNPANPRLLVVTSFGRELLLACSD